MYFVAAVLVVLSGVFYGASHHEIGGFGADVCRYGSTFWASLSASAERGRAGRHFQFGNI